MKTLARITAVVLIVVGILGMLSALAAGTTGVVRSLMAFGAAARPVRAGGFVSLLLVAYLFTQGLVVMGIGEGLYTLAALANK